MPKPGLAKETVVYRFGVFQFHAATLELAKNSTRLRLQPQPAKLLRLLLENANVMVSRELIHELLWKDGTIVDFETGVNRCIRQLRTALSDDAVTPRYIRTFPKLGYSFIAPVAGRDLSSPASPGSKPSGAPQSIAVLPFVNFGGDPQ